MACNPVAMAEVSKYAKTLSDLERETRVDPKDVVEEQAVSDPRVYVSPGDLDRGRLLSPTVGRATR